MRSHLVRILQTRTEAPLPLIITHLFKGPRMPWVSPFEMAGSHLVRDWLDNVFTASLTHFLFAKVNAGK